MYSIHSSEPDSDDDSYWYTDSDSEEDDYGPETDDDDEETDEEEECAQKLVLGNDEPKIPSMPGNYDRRMICWSSRTHYNIVKEVIKLDFNYHLTKNRRKKWDLAWWDGPPPISLLSKMQGW